MAEYTYEPGGGGSETWLFAVLAGAIIAIVAIKTLNNKSTIEVRKSEESHEEVKAGTYDYTINGQTFHYATNCFTESGNLICDAEDGTRLLVDSYTPIYYEEKK